MTTSQSTSPDASDVAEAVEDHSESAARKARKEAQQLRARLRDAEAERDALAADIAGLRESTAALQRAEVERLASGRLSDPTDLWLTGWSWTTCSPTVQTVLVTSTRRRSRRPSPVS